jgi:hypothetical protein
MSRHLRLLFLFLLPLVSCDSNEIGNSDDVKPSSIFFDYHVSGEEGEDNITVKLQYRFGGPHGTTLLLNDPSKVELDGQLLRADSSKLTGAFYEVQKPVQSFKGDHVIVFTDRDKKQYKESFHFEPLVLRTQLPKQVQSGDLVLDFDGLEAEDVVRVVLTDTSFTSDGINRLDTVRNGRVLITSSDLQGLSNGPVNLEIYHETERPVKNSTPEGGIFSLTYGIKRDFILKK